MRPPRRATRQEFERRETLDVSLRLSWTTINAPKREAGCASAIRRLQHTDAAAALGGSRKSTHGSSLFPPRQGTRSGKAGGLFVQGQAEPGRGGRPYGRYGES